VLSETVAAVNWAVCFWLERHCSCLATIGADYLKAAALVLRIFELAAAIRASFWLILKAFFGVKFLFTGCERKVAITISTFESFVFVTHISRVSFQ
jgi:hypothetical protein